MITLNCTQLPNLHLFIEKTSHLIIHIVTCITDYRRVLYWMIGFIAALYIHTTRGYGQYSAIAILHTFQFTVARALGFSVFTIRILPTVL
jgi:hypothetical protein